MSMLIKLIRTVCLPSRSHHLHLFLCFPPLRLSRLSLLYLRIVKMLAVLYALSLLLQEVSPVAVPSTPQHEKRQSYPDPICSGACGAVHDPSVIKSSNGTYFRFATFSNIAIATAPSLRGPWINQGSAFPQGVKTGIPGNSTVPPSASSVWVCDRLQWP